MCAPGSIEACVSACVLESILCMDTNLHLIRFISFISLLAKLIRLRLHLMNFSEEYERKKEKERERERLRERKN